MSKGVAILGATGSIGQSTLKVLAQHPDRFHLVGVTARNNRQGLSEVVARWRPAFAVMSNSSTPGSDDRTSWRTGTAAIEELVSNPDVDIVVNAVVGAAGLPLTIAALKAGKRVALANKESLVCAGPLVLEAAESGGGQLLPVDSEHSAILQCLTGGSTSGVERLVITASGGPFREADAADLEDVVASDALQHPTWDMGAKITIDSATLANKALEVIEAHFLFDIGYDRIEAVVHPQSIIHSMVEFADGSVLAQMGYPTMEIPILYALSYPDRLNYDSRRFNPIEIGSLTFEPIREKVFPTFSLGVEAGKAGGTFPAVFNAANEIAVARFLEGAIGFPQIASAIAEALDRWKGDPLDSIDSVLAADRWSRETTTHFIDQHAHC